MRDREGRSTPSRRDDPSRTRRRPAPITLGAAGKKKPEKPVNLNTATVEELAQLPGIGEVTARRIVRHREKSGKFRSVDELLVVRGISQKKLEALRPYLTVEAGVEKKRN